MRNGLRVVSLPCGSTAHTINIVTIPVYSMRRTCSKIEGGAVSVTKIPLWKEVEHARGLRYTILSSGTKLDGSFRYSAIPSSIMALSAGLAGSVTGFQYSSARCVNNGFNAGRLLSGIVSMIVCNSFLKTAAVIFSPCSFSCILDPAGQCS